MKFKLTTTIPASTSAVFNAWLTSKAHTAMTGGKAICTKRKGGSFSAWDGYIQGKNIELRLDEYIKQSWRTVEFKSDQPDSILEISLEPKGKNQCKLILIHSELTPADQKYKQGWKDSYITPMKQYFSQLNEIS
ncbi:MAG: SRPBCC domain-containing protein [Saprospiraceae bacterium]